MRLWACGAALGLTLASAQGIPPLAELEAARARIGEIRIDTQNIFDLDDPKENYALFRLANRLHIGTDPNVIRRALPFQTGDAFTVRALEEAKRLLLANRYLYEVDIRPVAYHDGRVDLQVATRDTWTLDPGISFGRGGGANTTKLSVKEYNLLGQGIAIGIAHTSDVDRKGNEFSVLQDRALGGKTSLNLSLAKYDDGKHGSFSVANPFYALETRRAAGVSATRDNRIDNIYLNGSIAEQYRHDRDNAEAFAGWSDGLVRGYTQRYSAGITYQADAYRRDPALLQPAQLPQDIKWTAPFLRYEVIEDDFQEFVNRDLIQRPEFFAMGLHVTAQVGRALTGLGSTRDLWLYSAAVSDGFNPRSKDQLLASASLAGQYGTNGVERQLLNGSARYYMPQSPRAVLFLSVAGDRATKPEPIDQLVLGGDNGLRGYPLRYQAGDRRVLFTAEERVYSDWYLWRLFRIGGAAFYDVGRAWGGPWGNTANAGWLGDVGFGLRILTTRSAFKNVLHADIAFPLHRDPNIQSVQFLVKVTNTF